MTVGEALAEARYQAGLTVDEVSERTRIREAVIRCIEQDDYGACGGDLYVHGYVRAIAGAIGIDAQPLIREYDLGRAEAPGSADAEADPAAAGTDLADTGTDPAATSVDLPVVSVDPTPTVDDLPVTAAYPLAATADPWAAPAGPWAAPADPMAAAAEPVKRPVKPPAHQGLSLIHI